jgi:uncharacterized protein
VRVRRPDSEDACSFEGDVCLQADGRWWVEGSQDQIDALAAALPARVVHSVGDHPIVELQFGNEVGRFRHPFGVLEVRSGKWTYAAHRRMFDELGGELAILPFAARDGASEGVVRRTGQDLTYHQFVFLRHLMSPWAEDEHRVDHAMETILAAPHRVLSTTHRKRDTARVAHVDARTFRSVMEARTLVPAPRVTPLARALDGHVPSSLLEPVRRHTVDTPENRFVKAFLDEVLGLLRRLSAALENRESLRHALGPNLERIERLFRRWRGASLWHDVGTMRSVPMASTVLQRARGYRTLYRAAARFRTSTRLPVDAETAEYLLQVHDVAQLYELWCMFAVVRAVRSVLGAPRRMARADTGDLQATLRQGATAEWPGVRVSYNRTFRLGRGSWSLQLRPDVTVEIKTGPNKGLHLMDAKFKLSHLPTADTDPTHPVNADLAKMHAYRDALTGARSAWVLYPGTEGRWLTPSGWPDGLGAIPLRPGADADLQHVVRTLLRPEAAPQSGFAFQGGPVPSATEPSEA